MLKRAALFVTLITLIAIATAVAAQGGGLGGGN